MNRKRLVHIITVLTIIMATLSTTPANATAWRWDHCRFQYVNGAAGWSVTEVRSTIRCAVQRYGVPGGLSRANYIAYRESRFHQYADNSYSSASGIFQWVDSTWSSVRSSMGLWWNGHWNLRDSVWNARSNVLAAIRYAHKYSWGPWGG